MNHWKPTLVLGLTLAIRATTGAAEVGLININGAIGPATASYLARAIRVAGTQRDNCLIIELDTPGGLLDSMKSIIESLYASPVPTIVYVAPAGARAASAGCFITLAADVAAMAPSTTIGAAHPVEMGLGGVGKTDDVMKEKLENFASSYIAAIAQKRGHNAAWAKSSVLQSASITAAQALKQNVVNIVARDLPDLLQQLHGRKVEGKVLNTAQATVVRIPMSAGEAMFHMLWRPEIMLLLMLVAIYGLFGELSHPGAILPGVAGGTALILTLYLAAVLPINVAGLALIGLALVLFVVDIFTPTHGILTFGGIAAFFLGALMLFNHAEPAFHLSLAYIIPATLVTAAFFVFVAGAGIRAQWLPVRAGSQTMLGKTVPALTRIDKASGKVFAEGEYWSAVSDTPIESGQRVEIVALEGLTLKVKPDQKT